MMSQNNFFIAEHLALTPSNWELISEFKSKHSQAQGLVTYLKTGAADEESLNLQRTYLVKDSHTKELAAFFSLKAGSVMIPKAMPNDKEKDYNVRPGIELSNFAINKLYADAHPGYTRIGETIFVENILPILKRVMDEIGVRYLYIFALPNEALMAHYEDNYGFKRLPKDVEGILHKTIKPEYDEDCIFMYMDISSI